MTVNVQDLPSVASYGMKPGDISRAFLNYQAMAMAQRINELQTLAGLPGNTVDVSKVVSNHRTMLSNIVKARNDVDRLSADSTTVINAGTTAGGTQLQFNKTSLDLMDRVYGAYLTQIAPYFAAPPPTFPAALSRSFIRRSPIVGTLPGGVVRSRLLGPRRHRLMGYRSKRPFLSSPFGSLKSFTDWLTTATNLSGAAGTYQAWAASQKEPDSGNPVGEMLDSVSAVAGGMSGMLGFYSQTFSNPVAAMPVAAASAVLGVISSGASLLNDFGHELGAFAYVLASGDSGDPEVLADAFKEIDARGAHAGIDAAQLDLSLISWSINSEGMPLYSSALNTFGPEIAAAIQQSALDGGINTGLQAAGLWVNYQSFLLDGGMQTLYQIDAGIENEVSSGAVNLTNAFGQVVGNMDISYPGVDYPPLAGVDISSDYNEDTFDALAGTNGNYVVYVPLSDPNFDYSNAEITGTDLLSDGDLGSVNVNLSGLNSQGSFGGGTITGSCTDDDAGDPDEDDPDCDNLGLLVRPGRRMMYLATSPKFAPGALKTGPRHRSFRSAAPMLSDSECPAAAVLLPSYDNPQFSRLAPTLSVRAAQSQCHREIGPFSGWATPPEFLPGRGLLLQTVTHDIHYQPPLGGIGKLNEMHA
jgi:hypothetical protein